mmetsp:Transcript_11904/g.14462  ORF Transcript_11904/g.14462 Transcript_11904/m.14462 type:complete len:143 (-) Transcript_11904:227-655(-)
MLWHEVFAELSPLYPCGMFLISSIICLTMKGTKTGKKCEKVCTRDGRSIFDKKARVLSSKVGFILYTKDINIKFELNLGCLAGSHRWWWGSTIRRSGSKASSFSASLIHFSSGNSSLCKPKAAREIKKPDMPARLVNVAILS